MKKLFAAVLLVSLLAIVAFPLAVSAAHPGGVHVLPETIKTQANLFSLITLITNWVFTIFLILAVIFIILAGLQFLTAGGKPEGVSEARQKLIWAAVGILVALLARGIPAVLENLVKGIPTQ